MPSYVITGVSKGLGWELLTQISRDSKNIVIGIVRNKPATNKKIAAELPDRTNISILEADITNYAALKKAAADTATITGGCLDYIIANAGYVAQFDAYDGIEVLGQYPDELTKVFQELMNTNVLGNIYLYNLFMPLILVGKAKKVVVISSGMADMDMVNKLDLEVGPLYASSKAAMNLITAKFSAQYKNQGVLFLGICPGMVDVGHFTNPTPEQMAGLGGMLEKFKTYSPGFKGPDNPPESIKAVLGVVESKSIDNGDGGAYLSHFGNKQWV